jgi:hypothetical protein
MGCFLIGVTGHYTTDGQALLGSVSDNPYDIRTFVRSIHPQDKLAHVGTELVTTKAPSFSERGYFCREGDTSRGVNAAGLAFTYAMLFENKKLSSKKPKASFSQLMEQMMEQCHTVGNAIDLLGEVEAVDPPFSIILADAKGVIAHIEAGSFGVEVLYQYNKKKPGAIIAVNCYHSKKNQLYNDPDAACDNPSNNNGMRLQRGKELCDQWKGKIDIDVMAKILSDHGNRDCDPLSNPLLEAWGFSICNHGTRKSDEISQPLPWGTVSAEIMQPSIKTLHYCYGWPCKEKPSYKDQLFQENSWGTFRPFTIAKDMPSNQNKILTTTDGMII